MQTNFIKLKLFCHDVFSGEISKDENDSNEVAVTYSLESARLIEKGERYEGQCHYFGM